MAIKVFVSLKKNIVARKTVRLVFRALLLAKFVIAKISYYLIDKVSNIIF